MNATPKPTKKVVYTYDLTDISEEQIQVLQAALHYYSGHIKYDESPDYTVAYELFNEVRDVIRLAREM